MKACCHSRNHSADTDEHLQVVCGQKPGPHLEVLGLNDVVAHKRGIGAHGHDVLDGQAR